MSGETLTSCVNGWLAAGGFVACCLHFWLRRHKEAGLDKITWPLVIVLWPFLLVILSLLLLSRSGPRRRR